MDRVRLKGTIYGFGPPLKRREIILFAGIENKSNAMLITPHQRNGI